MLGVAPLLGSLLVSSPPLDTRLGNEHMKT
jgi:hypothetical protein